MNQEDKLRDIITRFKKPCIGFSGGVDSTLLLYETLQVRPVTAVFCAGPMVSSQDKRDVYDFAAQYNADLVTIEGDVLSVPEFKHNATDRCYHCKKYIFGLVAEEAEKAGCDVIFDGANMDDLHDYRPGMRAAKEIGVVSPFIEAQMTKADIYALSRANNLFTMAKPPNACLATRLPTGETITLEKLALLDKAEAYLKELGFGLVRLRFRGGRSAVLACEPADFIRFKRHQADIAQQLALMGISLSPEPMRYQMGSMNRFVNTDDSQQ